MAYKINPDVCVACGTCQGECPAGAIKEGDVYSIDPNICLDCGTCASVCPTGAIEAGE
ncbi:MAG: 4Fe-4S binding protein [Bacteroidales bacterium]|nr:4Fe-4S binding protein [Bacteroidales bacterium]MBQ7468219.1 4Fe-4S binding protein [Bacteroidales bacterium]MBQ8462310.1 4Fe-4S binding protein [Bacteroidales bacterium]MCR5364325.1 4Fe-4S binding protein [Bacteroidales bacterium]MDT3360851.1 4Fe-4S binding protein [Bacteroidota bacterium]